MSSLILSGDSDPVVVVPGSYNVTLQTPAANPYNVRLGNCCTPTESVAAAARIIEGSWASSRRERVIIELSAIVVVSIEMDATATASIDLTTEIVT